VSEDALARFEALVQAQRPAAVPWQPVTDYSMEGRTAIEGCHPRLIQDVLRPSRVLDMGAGPGHLARLLRSARIDVEECDITPTPTQTRFDLGASTPVAWPRQADLVICREVLEHLTVRQIRHAVTNLCTLSSRYVYVTTRFHPAPSSLLDVATSDDLDPTHITMLSQELLRVLFVVEGFRRCAECEQRMDWRRLGRVLVYERAV
jgi:hypothetical protein